MRKDKPLPISFRILSQLKVSNFAHSFSQDYNEHMLELVMSTPGNGFSTVPPFSSLFKGFKIVMINCKTDN